MTRSIPTPPIPPAWLAYIKRSSRKFAFGVFDADDAEQVARLAFLRARKRYVAAKGAFENYAKAAIYHALLRARRAEQRHWTAREDPGDDRLHELAPSLTAEEENRLDAIAAAAKARAIDRWRPTLPPKLATVCDELYFRDRSQRDLATSEGVSQPRISQRNSDLLALARKDLKTLRD